MLELITDLVPCCFYALALVCLLSACEQREEIERQDEGIEQSKKRLAELRRGPEHDGYGTN